MVKRFRSMTYPYIAWIIAIIVVPMLLIVLYAFTTSGNSVLTFQFTFENFARFVTDKVFMDVLLRSLYIALITTLICVALGYPIAYVIAQRGGRSNTILILLITMPTWVNMLVRTYAWMGILQDEGIFNTILSWFGIGPVSMIHTSFAVILGMVYNYLPYMILPLYTVIMKIDRRLIEAASDLGCTPSQVFTKVILPLSGPGILSGLTMVFVPAVSTFYISQKLGSTGTTLIGDVIESQFKTAYNPNLGAAMSLILMVLIFVCVSIMNHFGENEDEEVMAKV